MSDQLNRKDFHEAVDTVLSGLQADPWLYQRVAARLEEGEKQVKRKISTTLVIALIIVMLSAVAVAATLLSHKEVVEQIAIPMAVQNDGKVGINNTYSAEELTELVRVLNENGITLEENSTIMQLMQNGQGYYEEETIMAICRQAFGGNYYTWTLEEQDWFEHLMVDIGFYESYVSRLPGTDNMKYEDAEAFAFRKLRQKYGQELEAENREMYQLSRQFYHDPENGGKAVWSFTLEPLDVTYGQYSVRFLDEDPVSTAYVSANIPDWTKPYTASELLNQFHVVHSWAQGSWSQSVWQQLHEMMQNAQIEEDNAYYTACRGYLLTAYPEPTENEISRDEAVRIGREALHLDRAALDSAVLTEYEGSRTWLVGMTLYPANGRKTDDEAGNYVIAVNSTSGKVESIRKSTGDDDISFAFIPQAAYEKAWEGILKNSDFIRIAKDALQKAYPDLNMDAYTILDRGSKNHNMYFTSKSIHQGDASVMVTSGGHVLSVTADTEPLNGDNLFKRFSAAYSYFGLWDQAIWVQLGQEMEALEPTHPENLPLKNTRYPQEASVTIDRKKAQELAIRASGKRAAEVNTCVLVEAKPHPVWILRLLTDEPDDPVLGIDAETGKVVFTEQFKTDYTPTYVLYSLPETWRKMELEKLGAPYMAKVAITHKFGDMGLDEPELDVDNTGNWECQQDGLTVRYIGRWAGMKNYEVELDPNGFVLRCEKSESASTEVRPDMLPEFIGEIIPTPTPLPNGKPWFFGMDFADAEFWNEMESKMEEYGVTVQNIREKTLEWAQQYGDSSQWPTDCQVIDYFMSQTDTYMLKNSYPIFPHEGKKTREEIYALAREAFHQEADESMGAEWVDQLYCNGMLWSRHIIYNLASEQFDEPVWYINMLVFDKNHDPNDWEAKGYVILNEDGVVLRCVLELMSNG